MQCGARLENLPGNGVRASRVSGALGAASGRCSMEVHHGEWGWSLGLQRCFLTVDSPHDQPDRGVQPKQACT